MRTISRLTTAILVIIGINFHQRAEAGLLGSPLHLRAAVQHIRFNAPTLPPMAYTQFCIRYVDECTARKMVFRGGPIKLDDDRLAQLREVNDSVNSSIAPEHNDMGLPGETWLIGPSRGDCNDYAVTKRHELIERGWPPRVLLLSEVVTHWGEHHLVLLVRTRSGDLVLDNMTSHIKPWLHAPYQWVRIQSPGNPHLWSSIVDRRA
jgi:predicted transglutaminase-like cysteine proteinase